MAFLKNLFAKIGAWFKGLFNAAEKAWDKLAPELQEALLKGSGIVAEINAFAGSRPEFIYEMLEAKFPGLTKEKIAEALGKATEALNIAGDAAQSPDIYDVLAKIQGQLDRAGDKDWAKKSSFIAKIIAQFFAPEGTKWSVFELIMEFVFQKFVKKAA